jgi:hypothetical protein
MNNFGGYVLFLLIIAVLLFTVVLWGLSRKRKVEKESEKAPNLIKQFYMKNKEICPINFGNVSIMFDLEQNVYIIPYVKDLSGMGKPADNPKYIASPYSCEILGMEIRNSLKSCEKNIPFSDAEFMRNLGAKGWKEFSYGKRSISIHYRDGYGVVFNSTRRRVDGSYQFNKFGFEEIVNNDVSDKILGETALKLLSRCR